VKGKKREVERGCSSFFLFSLSPRETAEGFFLGRGREVPELQTLNIRKGEGERRGKTSYPSSTEKAWEKKEKKKGLLEPNLIKLGLTRTWGEGRKDGKEKRS